MTTSWIALLAAPALAASLVFPSASSAPAASSGDRLYRIGDELARIADEDAFDAQASRRKLTSRDLGEREREFDRLAELAARDGAVRKALEEWNASKDDTELAWTSRLLLRQSRTAPNPLALRRDLRGRGQPGIDDLMRRFDELQDRFGGIDSMFEDLQRELDRMQLPPLPGAGSGQHEAQSYSLSMTPDGVKIEVEVDVDGHKKKQTYTGKSLDEILEANPELKDKIGTGPRIQLHGPGGGLGRLYGGSIPSTPDAPLVPDQRSVPRTRSGVRTDILGIQYSEPSEEARREAQLADDIGIQVERVEPNTIAAAVGVQTGDVVVSINGRDVRGAADVQQALRDRRASEDVRVDVVDAQGKRRTLTWKSNGGEVQRF